MRLLTINLKAVIAALAPLALTGAILAPTAAARTTGFTVQNFTSHRMVLTRTTGDFEAPGTAPGKVLGPGESYGFEVNNGSVGDGGGADLYYDILGENGKVIGHYHATLIANKSKTLYDRDSSCQVSGFNGQCTAGHDVADLRVLDPPGTSYTIPAVQAQVQSQWLVRLCEDGTAAGCAFELSNETHTWSGPHQVSDAIDNPYDTPGKYTYKIEDRVAQTDMVGVAVKLGTKLFDAVDVSIQAHYDHEWTKEHTVTEAIEWEVPPHTRLYFAAVDPVIRDTGTFKITLGNTTWTLPDVYFDSPDLSSGGWHDYLPVEQQLG
jgi:hypothetical protein